MSHNKDICKKCYRYHERVWGDDEETDWQEGRIACPVDNFNTMQKDGVKFTPPKPMRNLFGALFGWHNIKEPLPVWCVFKQFHSSEQKDK